MTNTSNLGIKIRSAAIVLGLSVMITQIVLLREFLSIFNGVELVIGIILSIWMFLTGLGAYLGRFFKYNQSHISTILILGLLIGLLPVVTVFLINSLRNEIFLPGQMLNITEIAIYTTLMLLPFCIISGMSYSVLSIQLSGVLKEKSINRIYALESLGSLAGGLTFSMILIYYVPLYTSLLSIFIINLIMVFFLSLNISRKLTAYLIITLGISLVAALLIFNPAKIAIQMLYHGQEVLTKKTTPYNQLVATKTSDQINVFGNGIILYSSDNVIENEENVHYAMGQAYHPEKVLIISGGYYDVITEALKYPGVKLIDYLEPDPYLIRLLDELEHFETDRNRSVEVNIINQDPVLFLKTVKTKYDVILVNLPDPSTAQLNRFYTIEFLNELDQHLEKNGLVSLTLSYTGNYTGKEAGMLNSCLYAALKDIFRYVLIIPGQNNYFIGSDKPVSYNLTGKINLYEIDTRYVNDYYIDTSLVKARSLQLMSTFETCQDYNTNFKPEAYYQHLLYWFSYDKINILVVLAIILLPLILILFRLSPVNLGLFAGGFTASSMEFIIIISFQIIYGYVYHMIGIIITAFMAGLVVGSYFVIKGVKRRSVRGFVVIQSIIGLLALSLPFLMRTLDHFSTYTVVVHLIFLLITMISGMLTGLQYAYATTLLKGSTGKLASSTYGSDLLGSGLGVLLMAAILIPLLGMVAVGFILALLNITVIVVILYKHRRIVI